MKRFIATAIASLAITTTPTYANTGKAVELGIYRGMLYCEAFQQGATSTEEIVDIFVYSRHPKIQDSLKYYSAWKASGNQTAIDLMIETTVDYALDNCRIQFRRYMEGM